MSLDFLDITSLVIAFLTPLAIIGLVIFAVLKLNSIEKKVINLEKLLNEMNNHKMQ
ncbi:MAG: hypothetical protein LIR50_02580 [Bacillota bacterium]|nr:hypothetical protein [Bacillota bacterium]